MLKNLEMTKKRNKHNINHDTDSDTDTEKSIPKDYYPLTVVCCLKKSKNEQTLQITSHLPPDTKRR